MSKILRKTRTYTLGIRIDPGTHKRIEERAQESRMKAMEWCRFVIQRALEYDPDLFVLLQEMLATRRETRALIRELIQGRELTAERFNFLIRETEEKKQSLALKAVQQAREAASRLPSEDQK